MKVDAYISQHHYLSHVQSVWKALPDDARGTVYIAPQVVIEKEAARFDLDVKMGVPNGKQPVIVLSGQECSFWDRTILLEHGAGQSYAGLSHASWSGGGGRDNAILFCVPNEYAAARNRARYPHIRCEVVGSPHVEWLRTLPYEPQYDVCFSRHWSLGLNDADEQPIPETKTAWWHYQDAIVGHAHAHEGRVAFHAHPRDLYEMARLCQIERVPFLARFEDVVRHCGVYVADNTSTLFEFAAMGRPVVLLNPPWYRTDVKHGGRFWDWAHVGWNAWEAQQLFDVLGSELLQGATALGREHVVAEVFPLIDGAAKAAATAIVSVP